ncbi:MAG: hypothetical protein HND52_13555 [Ignavibacteriae bacterium]|nr:hypothetical protein [Ignavibacteriota bacterium]NOG98979.1 hypothetical protein [Ignavibacteriota bacterium]
MKTEIGYFLKSLITILFISFVVLSCTEKSKPSLISSIQKEAAEAGDKVKLRMINSAVQIYELEKGKTPKSLDQVVKEGYLNAEDIINHKGEKFTYSPEANNLVQKSCGSCSNGVPNSSKAGDTCPYCGVTWGMEVKSY